MMIGFGCLIQLLSKSLYSDRSTGMTSEILCLVSGVVVFIAFFTAIFTQTVTSFSLVQYLWKIIASSQVYIIEEFDRENDS